MSPENRNAALLILVSIGALVATILVGARLIGEISGRSSSKPVARRAPPSRADPEEVKLRAVMAYLPELKEVEWYEVKGTNVYIGFRAWPADGIQVLAGAARHGHDQLGGEMVTAWGLHADDPDRRPDDDCYGWAICHKGRIETSAGH